MEQIILVIAGLNIFLTVCLLIVISMAARPKRIAHEDTHFKHKLGRRLEEQLEKDISKMVDLLSVRLQRGAELEISKLQNLNLQFAKELADFVKEQQKAIVSQLEYMVANEVVKTREDLEKYKRKRMQDLSEALNAILEEAAKDALPKLIDPAAHKDIVMKSLEKAKAEKTL